jgi:hypothetical protein
MKMSGRIFLKMINVSYKIFREDQNTHFMFNNFFFFFRKLCRLRDNVDTYGTAEEATDDNKAHAHYVLGN